MPSAWIAHGMRSQTITTSVPQHGFTRLNGHRERGGRVAALIVRVATICYDYADEARSYRLWEISAGTEPSGGAWHHCAASPRLSAPPPSVSQRCMSQSTPGVP